MPILLPPIRLKRLLRRNCNFLDVNEVINKSEMITPSYFYFKLDFRDRANNTYQVQLVIFSFDYGLTVKVTYKTW